MNFYFNGCSFTYGDELKNLELDCWPALVAKNQQANFVNDAVSGGTNYRTVYKTLHNINKFDCFFIAWTDYNRFTEYNPVDNYEINFNPHLKINTSLHVSDDLKINYWKFKDYAEIYYKHWQNELFNFKTWLQQIIFLQILFEKYHKKYVMINTFSNNLEHWLQPKHNFISAVRHLFPFFDNFSDDQLLDEHEQIQKLCGMIDTSRFIGWNDFCIRNLPENIARGPQGHILEDGHKLVAEKILYHYTKQYDSN